MSAPSKVVQVVCPYGHSYEVPSDSAIAHNTENGATHLPSEKCLACLQHEKKVLDRDAYLEDLYPIFEGEPNDWAVQAARVDRTIREMRELYTSPTSQAYRLLPEIE